MRAAIRYRVGWNRAWNGADWNGPGWNDGPQLRWTRPARGTAGNGRAGHRKPRAARAAGARRGAARALSALSALLACYCAMLGFAAAQQQTPPANAALAVWLQQHGLRSGLAGYWEASV